MLGAQEEANSSGFIDTYANNLTLSLTHIFTLHFDSNLFSEVRSGVLVFSTYDILVCACVCVCALMCVCIGGRYT